MPIIRDATKDCSNDSGSATSLTATYPGGAAAAGRLLIAVARIADTLANITRPAGSTPLFSLVFSGGPALVGVAKEAVGTETGMQFSHSGGANEMTVAAFQYTGQLSPLAIDTSNTGPSDFGQHQLIGTGTINTTYADELIIEAAALAGAATSPRVDSGTIIAALRSNELLVAERSVSVVGAYNDTFRWTNNNFCEAAIASIKAAAVNPTPLMAMI